MFFNKPLKLTEPSWQAMTASYREDETTCVKQLLSRLDFTLNQYARIQSSAQALVLKVRAQEADTGGIEALMRHYDLSTKEGILLMCIAEALLRIPDKETQDLLIQDKLTSARWDAHIGKSSSNFVNLATWSLALSGRLLNTDNQINFFQKIWKNLLHKTSEPVIRQAIHKAVQVMSEHFVLGRSMMEALKHSQSLLEKGYRFSYDMLGEVARTMPDAEYYFAAYQEAISTLSQAYKGHRLSEEQGISVKLSALYPRYEPSHREKAIPFLTKRLKTLCQQAKADGLSITVDAEESDRLEMSFKIIEGILADPAFNQWNGLGLALQAYQKRAYSACEYLIAMAKNYRKQLKIRLVKGAYWDTEIKLSQIAGFNDYPVFTRKTSTDVSYLACAKLLLSEPEAVYAQFATHNAHSVAAILEMAEASHAEFEFQKLQGMGTSLHEQLISRGIPCRIYAPVGSHENLLPYLVRRLLENGANSSFVNRMADPHVNIEEIIADPILYTQTLEHIPNPRIPLPKDIYTSKRLNSQGVDLSHHEQTFVLEQSMIISDQKKPWFAAPFACSTQAIEQPILNPMDHRDIVGYCTLATKKEAQQAIEKAVAAFPHWDARPVKERALILNKIAETLETHRAELVTLMVREAGKTIPDALAEVREAVDFCRYYAVQAVELMTEQTLLGPTGERNLLRLSGLGPIVCISPWNFPVAIFIGQIVAALVVGNTVIAKPAEQTPLVAQRVVELCYASGIPQDTLQFLPGEGALLGPALVSDKRVMGVMFTGSTETAKQIQQHLAQRPGPIARFIAETGGINAMIVDSSALPEQVIRDVVHSAFGSAGQRCSALRLLCIQEEVADEMIQMLQGAIEMLVVGDPSKLETDVGPVIDSAAQARLNQHIEFLKTHAKCIAKPALPPITSNGSYIAPQAYELSDISQLKEEFFGPILHVIRYSQSKVNALIESINAKGYGLTFGIQSRIQTVIETLENKINAGNVYVNRNIIGAVVGLQPFGGVGLSGTGPKAGGPHYLPYLCREKTVSIDTTAAGGNASLMTLQED